METTGKIRQIEFTENSFFYCSRVANVQPEHTQLHPICRLDTPEGFAWITFSCLSLITRCQNSKSVRYRLTSGSKLIG